MKRLLWQALFFRTLQEQKKLFIIAALTVSLGVALALGIRLGTQSAVRSLEDNLLQEDSLWSDAIVATTAEAKLFLRDAALRHGGLIFSTVEGSLQSETKKVQDRSVLVHVMWGGETLLSNHTTQTSSLKSPTLMSGKMCEGKFQPYSALNVFDQRLAVEVQTSSIPLLNNCNTVLADPSVFSTPKLNNMLLNAPLYLVLPMRSDDDRTHYAELAEAAVSIPGLETDTNKKRISRLESVTISFRTNLQLMGFIALFIGFAMVHHIFSLLVAKQSKTLATLSALGIGRWRQVVILLCLALVLGGVASILGTILGIAAGQFLSGFSSLTIKNLYDSLVDAEQFRWSTSDLLYGTALGFTACLAGCMHPVLKSLQLPVATIMRDGSFESHDTGLTPKQNLIMTSGILALSLLCLAWPMVWNRIPWTALLACLGILVASALIAKQISSLLYTRFTLQSLQKKWVTQLRIFFAPQAAVVIQILTLTFTLTFGVKGMAESFRETLSRWTRETLKADLWIRTIGGAASPLPQELISRIENLPSQDVRAVDRLSIGPAALKINPSEQQKPVLLAAARFQEQSKVEPMGLLQPYLKSGGSQSQIALQVYSSSQKCTGTINFPCAAYISEPIVVHFSLQDPVGTIICPNFRSQEICFEVLAVYQDFGSDQGVILTDENVFNRLISDAPKPSFTNIYLQQPKTLGAQKIEQELRQIALDSQGTMGFETLENLRGRILLTFDNTFRITDALYVLCGIIAIIATVSGLNLQILLRNREWSIHWAIGISHNNILRRFAWWSAAMAIVAAFMSIAGGIALSAILVYAVNYYSFGYSLELAIPWSLPLLILAVAGISGYLSGRLQGRTLLENITLKSITRE